MAANFEYIETQGLIVADTDTVLTQVEDEWLEAFGADLVTTPDTPQGVMIVAETTARVAVIDNNAAVANQINPNEAGGVFLDAICAFLGLERTGLTFTRAAAVPVAGVPNTIIPAGSRARTQAGDIFVTAGNIQLDNTGNAVIDFIAAVGGPVPCPAGELNQVVDMVLGWETVNNAGITPILGALVQSDASLRQLRNNTLALQGISTVEAQVSGLYALNGVLSLQYRENVADTTETIDGIVMKPHSVWACVDGGTDLAIATSLLENKTDGAGWNGAIEVDVKEPASGQTYAVLFDRPTLEAIAVRVTMRQGTSTQDLPTTVPQAVVDYSLGLINGDPGFVVGGQVSPFDIAGAIYSENPGAFVSKVEVSLASAIVWQTTELPIAINQKATVTVTSVTIIVLAVT